MKNSNLEIALSYAARGWAVFPIRPKKKDSYYFYPKYPGEPSEKFPKGNPCSWKGQASADPERVKEFWMDHPDANIGIACGDVSNGLAVLDFDIKPDKNINAVEFLRDYEHEHGEFPETVRVITGRGGYHFLYYCEESYTSKEGLYEGVDIRANGGYIVAPPSIHPNGKAYEWEAGAEPGEVEVAQMDDIVKKFIADSNYNKSSDNGNKVITFEELCNVKDNRHDALKKYIGSRIAETRGKLNAEEYLSMLRSANEALPCPIGKGKDDKADEFEKTVAPMVVSFLTKEHEKENDPDYWSKARQAWCNEHPGEEFNKDWVEAENALKRQERFNEGFKSYLDKKKCNETDGKAEQQDDQKTFKPFQRIESDHTGDFEKLPDFPIDSLPEPVKSYVKEIAAAYMVDVAMPATICLSDVAAACMGVFAMNPKNGWEEPLNLYTLVVAYPSERKSPVISEISKAIHDYESEWNNRHKEEIKESQKKKKMLEKRRDNITAELCKPNGGGAKKEQYNQDLKEVEQELNELKVVNNISLIRGGDMTAEALSQILQLNNERMLICSDEGGLIEIAAGRYSDRPNPELLLQAYSGMPYTCNRITREDVKLSSPNLTITLCIQPDPLHEIISEGKLNGKGFFERFLICYPRSEIGSRKLDTKPICAKTREKFRSLINKLYDIQTGEDHSFTNKKINWNDDTVSHTETISWDEGAYELSKLYFDEIEEDISEAKRNNETGFSGWLGKEHGTGMRIAAIIHVIKHGQDAADKPLEEISVQQAIDIMRFFRMHVHTMFKCYGSGQDNKALYLWKSITEVLGGESSIDMQTVYQKCKHKFPKRENLNEPLKELSEKGYILIDKLQGKTGSPKEIIVVNPDAIK